MATVKMHCPKCFGTGLIGTGQESVCPQCNGTGTISVDDTQTFASTNTTVAALITNGTSLVVPKAQPIPTAAVRILDRGK